MTKKERTILFNLGVIIYNIILGLIVEAILFIGMLFFINEHPNLGESVFIQILLPVVLLIGLIAAIAISVYTVGWFIRKFHLEDKLDQKVVSRYKKDI